MAAGSVKMCYSVTSLLPSRVSACLITTVLLAISGQKNCSPCQHVRSSTPCLFEFHCLRKHGLQKSSQPIHMTSAGTPSYLAAALWSFAILLVVEPAHSQPKAFNLIEAEVDGQSICRYPMDSLTTYLGRPSAVTDKEFIASRVGPKLHYHKKGLTFHLLPEKQDPQQGIYTVGIRLVETKKKNNKTFLPYEGKITRQPNKSWKISDVKEAFSEHEIDVSTPEEKKEELEGLDLGMDESEIPYTVTIQFDGHRVGFAHEGTTKFMERINIICEPGLEK